MSDDESRHGHLPKAGRKIFADNGSETVENDQTGLPPWAAALTAQIQPALAAQLAAQAQAHRAELQELVEECRASAHEARLAKAQLQDQQDEIEARDLRKVPRKTQKKTAEG